MGMGYNINEFGEICRKESNTKIKKVMMVGFGILLLVIFIIISPMIVASIKYDRMDFGENMRYYRRNCIRVCHNEKLGIINRWAKEIVPVKYDEFGFLISGRGFRESRARIGDKWGILNFVDGSVIVPVIYEELGHFNEQGIAVAMKNGKYGMVNHDGDVVVDFKYDKLDDILKDQI